MEHANKFFFLAGILDCVKVDFKRDASKMVLVFCHENDQENLDRLFMEIDTEKAIDSSTGKQVDEYFISYVMHHGTRLIQQSRSLPIRNPLDVWQVVIECVNDAFTMEAAQ